MDEFADLDISDYEDDSATLARRARIEAARLQARDYSAKLDEPEWYLTSETQSSTLSTTPPQEDHGSTSQLKDLHRRKIFAIQHHYLQRSYLTSLNLALTLLNGNYYIRGDGSEDVEVLDLILRSFLKLWEEDREGLVGAGAWKEQGPMIVEMARKWSSYRGVPTFSFTASKVLFLLSTDPSPPVSIENLQENLAPILNALKLHSTQIRYLAQLERVLQFLDRPVLAKALTNPNGPEVMMEDKRKAFEGLTLTEEERSTLEKVTGLRGEVKDEPQEDHLRDVRSL
ncbi:BZ3500_MvSof-1268-A1-R1_Chr4-4g07481 [Microbotryum saponariae]|uniref:BZ3500_MvSof-1268-A1-R1_Chr4-4g07481 protein n=1 Tax=Microbotryum saponariae TaxID=289078 RepID=A0A2X0MWI6_9BASI|nr:BZ3500_MvSof-1268-A1-R1_Chr4-4g07481 [Microbotryum saponariae]SDA07142.1 BZ3501_MvSof-1269-A2-R1_Chr4-3g07189 [Microbotryum saponariae]